jgi:hypothetical protein
MVEGFFAGVFAFRLDLDAAARAAVFRLAACFFGAARLAAVRFRAGAFARADLPAVVRFAFTDRFLLPLLPDARLATDTSTAYCTPHFFVSPVTTTSRL